VVEFVLVQFSLSWFGLVWPGVVRLYDQHSDSNSLNKSSDLNVRTGCCDPGDLFGWFLVLVPGSVCQNQLADIMFSLGGKCVSIGSVNVLPTGETRQ